MLSKSAKVAYKGTPHTQSEKYDSSHFLQFHDVVNTRRLGGKCLGSLAAGVFCPILLSHCAWIKALRPLIKQWTQDQSGQNGQQWEGSARSAASPEAELNFMFVVAILLRTVHNSERQSLEVTWWFFFFFK